MKKYTRNKKLFDVEERIKYGYLTRIITVASHRISKTTDLARVRFVQNGKTFRISRTQKRQRKNITESA